MTDEATIIHVDMDAFFASVEVARRPELAGKPVVVAGGGRGVVLAATYQARKFGIRSAMPLKQAQLRCSHLVVVPPDMAAYRQVSHDVMELLSEVTDQLEQVSVDEAFLDVRHARRRLGQPAKIAADIRAEVRRRHGITCSAGVGASTLIAKLASTSAKPDGLRVVPASDSVAFIQSLPIGALPGIGARTEETLRSWGIHTVADAAATDVAVLVKLLGAAAGTRLFELAWHRGTRGVVTDRVEKSIGAETTFEVDVSGKERWRAALLELATKTAARMRRAELIGRTVVLKVRTSDFKTVTRSRTLSEGTDIAAVIYQHACDLLAAAAPRLPVRLLGVRVEQLVPRDQVAQQLPLDEAAGNTGALSARRNAEVTMDRIRQRYGAGAVSLGSLIEVDPKDAPKARGELS